MSDEIYIPTAHELGRNIFAQLIFGKHRGHSLSLHTLLHIIGLKKVDLAKMTGLSQARIGHFSGGLLDDKPARLEAVPQERAVQFHHILRNVVEEYEELLANNKKDPKIMEKVLVKEMLPAVECIVKTCRKVLEVERKAGVA